MPKNLSTKEAWVKWLQIYGADKFFDSFVNIAQGAESICIHCHQHIYLDIVEGGGGPDWRTKNGDYGCDNSPDTNGESCGSHTPQKG